MAKNHNFARHQASGIRQKPADLYVHHIITESVPSIRVVKCRQAQTTHTHASHLLGTVVHNNWLVDCKTTAGPVPLWHAEVRIAITMYTYMELWIILRIMQDWTLNFIPPMLYNSVWHCDRIESRCTRTAWCIGVSRHAAHIGHAIAENPHFVLRHKHKQTACLKEGAPCPFDYTTRHNHLDTHVCNVRV